MAPGIAPLVSLAVYFQYISRFHVVFTYSVTTHDSIFIKTLNSIPFSRPWTRTSTMYNYLQIIFSRQNMLKFFNKNNILLKNYNPQWSLHLLEFLPTDLIQKLPYASEKYIHSSSIIYILLQNAQPWTYWKHNLLNANIQHKKSPCFSCSIYIRYIIFRHITMFF